MKKLKMLFKYDDLGVTNLTFIVLN